MTNIEPTQVGQVATSKYRARLRFRRAWRSSILVLFGAEIALFALAERMPTPLIFICSAVLCGVYGFLLGRVLWLWREEAIARRAKAAAQ